MGTTLHLHATADAVELEWRLALAAGGVVELGLYRATPRELVEAACATGQTAARRLGPVGEKLVVDAVAESAGGSLAPIAHSRGLRRSLGRIFAALGQSGLTARDLDAAVRQAGGAAARHGEEIARRLAAYQKHLKSGELCDDAAAWHAGCRAIASGARVAMLVDVDRVVTHDLVDWDAAHLQLLDALLARGLVVQVRLPASSDLPPQAARALDPTLSALEARHGAARLERVNAPLVRARAVDFTQAPTPSTEAREVARRVRDLVDAGAAPESIAVLASSAERRALLEAALVRYGVPVAPRKPPSAIDAPPVRIALELLALADDAIPRERFIQLLSSRYVAGEAMGPNGKVLPHEIARALREAYVTDASGRGYSDGLATWARGTRKHVFKEGNAETICRHVDKLVALIQKLPAEANVAQHCQKLHKALSDLELFERARGFRKEAPADSEAETRAIARDQAAMRELEVALADLPRAALRAGLKSQKLSRARFTRLLGELLAAARARAGGVRGAAVELSDFGGVAGRRFTHLFACGLVDGEVPARPPEDPLLGDDDRAALNRALGAPVLPLASRAIDRAALAFHVALAATDAAHLSWTRGDEDGAPQLRSPLVDDLHPRDGDVRLLLRDPIARARDARTVDELAARVLLECRGDRGSRLSPPDVEAAPFLPLLTAHDRPRLGRLEHLVTVEKRRHGFFQQELAAHAYVGVLRDPELLAELARVRLPGRREEPLSATSLEQYASCPYKFFLRSLLKAREGEENDDEIDSRTFGRLHHEVLERLFRRFADEGRLPLRGDASELELAEEVCDDVVDRWRKTEALGHPAIFAIKERTLREQVAAILKAEAKESPSPGCKPALFERPFGPLDVAGVWVAGKIDRIDMGDGQAVVLDYKAGRKSSYVPDTAPAALCDSAWQLPLYALAARLELKVPLVEARFYSLREAELTRPVREPADLPERLVTLHAAMRAGEFAVRPREDACETCNMESACRVRQLRTTDAPKSEDE
ncbi:MAG TPA: PD-(D/E)XK nuclease family protein [Polyangia bacterium]|nr:PD-(D/E)XK nuclease family protein [Polyangia bacterium]